jgi:V/A-type H+-transporting ATPase subunit C
MFNELTLTIGASAFTLIALGATMAKYTSQSSFMYSNARLVARTNYLIDGNKLSSLINSSNLSEMISKLKDTEYYNYFEGINKNNIKEFNSAIEKGFIDTIKELKKISPKKFIKVFDVYTIQNEAKLIKTFFRSRFSNIKIDERLIQPVGTIDAIMIKHLNDTKSIADLKVVLRDTSYAKILDKEYKTIEEFDSTLDKKMLLEITEEMKKLRFFDRKLIMQIFKKKRDIKFIQTLLKFRIRNLEKEKQEELIKTSGFDVKAAINSKDLKEFVNCFEKTEFYESMQKALSEYEKNDNYFSFEKELYSHYYHSIIDKDLDHPIGSYPIISYITKREIELKNLLIVAKGITSEISKEEIKRMIIV